MSADGLASTQVEQDRLKRIVVCSFEEALRLHPFDAYWTYFNWNIVHAGSKGAKAGGTCFGGREGSKNWGGGDACMDFDLAREFVGKHLPSCDVFLCYVKGWNGWPNEENAMGAVGTCHFRYVPRMLSAGRLQDAEVFNEVQLLPELKKRFDAMMAAFRAKLAADSPKYAALSVREWRKMTAEWKTEMLKGNSRAKRGPRDKASGKQQRVCWRIADGLNQYVDWDSYPVEMHPKDRPFPPFEAVPWYHWLLRGDPTVSVVPTLKCAYSHTRIDFLRFHENGEIEIVYPVDKDPEKWNNQYEVLKRQNGGRMPTTSDIKKNLFVTYYCHDACHLGGAALPEKGGIGGAPQFCAACREETVRSIYRYVSPVDGADPKPGMVDAPKGKKLVFSVHTMKPLDHYLAVEWRLDGAIQAKGASREHADRASGKRVARLPAFAPQPRRNQYCDPSESKSQTDPRMVAAALAWSSACVKETFALDPSALSPGEHKVEAFVIDETPWVLWDPEGLLEQRVEWSFVVG